MDFRKENSSPHVKDFQTEGDWIPATPAKSGSNPTSADKEEKSSNLTALAGVSRESQQGVSFQNSSSSSCVTVSDEKLAKTLQHLVVKSQLNGSNADVSIYNNFYMENVGKQNISFQALLAMADAAAVGNKARGDENGRSISFTSFSNVHVEGFQVGTSPVDLQRENQDISQGGFQIMGCTNPDTQQRVQHTGHIIDLNSVSGTMLEADFSKSIRSQFAPVTPDPTRRLERGQTSDLPSSSGDERKNQEKEEQNIEISPERITEKSCIDLEEQPQLLQEQSGDAVSMQLQENLNSDKGANEIANLNETPQQQKPRRRKHRPKVIIEGQPKRTRKPRTPKPDAPTGTPTGKRKYVRKKGVEKSSATPAAEANETNDPKAVEQTRKSCKRSINFDDDKQMNNEKSSCIHEETLRTEAQSFVQLKQGMEVTAENTDAGIAQMNQVLEGYLSIPENQANSPLTPNKSDLTCIKSASNAQNAAYRKGKCRIHFSDETHDKETITIESPNDSSCSTSAYMNNEKQARGRKRQHSGKIGQMEMCTFNYIGAQYNSCQAYQPIFRNYGSNFPAMHFPAIYKKKRAEEQHLTTISILSSMPAEQGHLRDIATGNFSLGSGTQDEQRSFNSMVTFDHTIKIKKKRTKGLTCVREQLPTPSGAASGVMQDIEASYQPHTCVEDHAADIHVKSATRKRTKRNSLGTSMASSPFYHHQSASDITGFLPWKIMDPVDVLIKHFEHLHINAQSSENENQERHALMPYYMGYQKKNALVLYQQDGTLVRFDDSFNQIRRRKPRPKVDLDDETTRVWKLLLEDINSQGIDGTDEEKEKWWEEERRVFRGRADSFIARMHLVQGDRRFSRWKGSVVDSVIGVFLTQNVSDHLSSSAFMSLAAQFPLKSEKNNEPADGAETSISVRKPEISEADPDETIRWHEGKSNQIVNDQSSVALQDAEHSEEKEVVSSNEFSRSSTNNIASKDKLYCEAINMCGSDLTMYHESAVNRSDAEVSELAASFLENHREVDDVLSSQSSVVSSQNSVDSVIAQYSERITSCSYSGAELADGSQPVHDLIQIQETTLLGVYDQERLEGPSYEIGQDKLEDKASSEAQNQERSTSCKPSSPSDYNLHLSASGTPIIDCFDLLGEENRISGIHQAYEGKCASEQIELSAESANQDTVQETRTSSPAEAKSCTCLHDDNINQQAQKDSCGVQQVFDVSKFSGEISDVTETITMADRLRKNEHMASNANLNDQGSLQINVDTMNEGTSKAKRVRTEKPKQDTVEWDSLRQQARDKDGKTRGNTPYTMDSLDYEAVRCADVKEIADAIKERGMNNKLAERMQAFLNRLVKDHGSINLEWLRDVPPDKAKEYLLSFRGLGLKSVECVRLLCLHHLAFPVDTNVGRIAVRLGWVPLQPLPESLQLHLLELYPIMESIQKYLWPRLCKLDQRTLYELHYQMITFGKVFCTKSKPNCNACPMRGECRHFASAFASARLSLPAPEDKSLVSTTESKASDESPKGIIREQQLPLPAPPSPPSPANQQSGQQFEAPNYEPVIEMPATPGPIIEVPTTPEQEQISNQEIEIEDSFGEDPDEIPTIKLNIEEFTQNLQNYMETNMELQDGEMSRALVELTQEAASIPTPKLKNVSQLRTEHQVYELPDSHPLLIGLDRRERDDPCPYLLAIWTPGETADSIQPPAGQCSSHELGRPCDEETCFSCSSIREANTQTVRGTLLIPCRTAMRGSFPLNGTYFQVNEVFADHDSSLNPIDVPRSWLWNLPRRTVFFGTSIPTIFKGLTTEGIQYCFWRGFVCVRGFDQRTRAPRPLMARLHFPASRLTRTRGRMDERAP